MSAGGRAVAGLAVLVVAISGLALLGHAAGSPVWAQWGEGRPVMPWISGVLMLILALLMSGTEKWLVLEVGVAVEGYSEQPAIRLTPAKTVVARVPKYLIRNLSLAGLLGVIWIAIRLLTERPGDAMHVLPPPHTALCLGLLFLASVSATYQRVSALIVIQIAGMIVMSIAASAVVGHLFDTRSPLQMGFGAPSQAGIGMALPTAVCLLALGAGYMVYAGRDFFIAVPVRMFTAFSAVALLMLALVAGPVLLGWLIAAAGWSDRYGRDSALALLVVLNGFLQLPVILHVARKLFFHEYQLKKTAESLRVALADKEVLAEKLHALTLRDPLTGLNNRRAFEAELSKAWRRCWRMRAPVALLFVDIDYFKRYNDHYGHPAGDACLVEVARILAESAGREGDMAARLGGEEFVLLLPDTTSDGARHVAGRLHERLGTRALEHGYSEVADRVTVSVGVSCCLPRAGLSPDLLIAEADKALYAAKRQGRNGTFVAPASGQAA
jgi:diguanylate cyclase (GGDEF)-like protein